MYRMFDKVMERYVCMSLKTYITLSKITGALIVSSLPMLILSVMKFGPMTVPISFGASYMLIHWVMENDGGELLSKLSMEHQEVFGEMKKNSEDDLRKLEEIRKGDN